MNKSFKSFTSSSLSSGFTLVEILIGITLMVIIFTGLFGAFQFGMKVVGQSKAQTTAIALANEKMEEIRNLPYKDVGTIGGIPAGVIPETITVARNKITFTIKTTVIYIDDPFDGLVPNDSLPKDYKRAKVKVSWPGFWAGEISLISDIAPKGIETEAGGGTLMIWVLNASGQGIPLANINLVNDQVFPPISANYQTNDSGNFILAGAPTSTEAYKVRVNKNGFSEERTYGKEEVANPAKPHLSVFEGQITEISFSIDQLSSFSVETRGRESFDDDFGNDSQLSEYQNISIINSEVNLAKIGEDYLPNGYLISKKISPANLINWDRLIWEDEESDLTDIKYQLLYFTSTAWEPVPESDLPGNIQGFDNSPADLNNLDIAKYPSLKIKAELATLASSTTPRLFAWHLTYNTPLIGNIAFQLQGWKIIGADQDDNPVYKYLKQHSSESNGKTVISDLEWDSYTFSRLAEAIIDLVETKPAPQPIDLLPATPTAVILYFKAENSLLTEIIDASTSEPIFNANVKLFNEILGYDQSKPTDEKGYAYFFPLKQAEYNLEVTNPDYQTTTTTVNVIGHIKKTISLEK